MFIVIFKRIRVHNTKYGNEYFGIINYLREQCFKTQIQEGFSGLRKTNISFIVN